MYIDTCTSHDYCLLGSSGLTFASSHVPLYSFQMLERTHTVLSVLFYVDSFNLVTLCHQAAFVECFTSVSDR